MGLCNRKESVRKARERGMRRERVRGKEGEEAPTMAMEMATIATKFATILMTLIVCFVNRKNKNLQLEDRKR